jgi:hypothetical protein
MAEVHGEYGRCNLRYDATSRASSRRPPSRRGSTQSRELRLVVAFRSSVALRRRDTGLVIA